MRSGDAYLIVGAEGAGQESIGVETLEPLAIRDIAFASGYVLHMADVHELYLESILFEDLEGCDPVDARRLYSYGGDTACFEPSVHGVKVGGEAAKRT